jgi:hypothetical protein
MPEQPTAVRRDSTNRNKTCGTRLEPQQILTLRYGVVMRRLQDCQMTAALSPETIVKTAIEQRK